VVPENVLPGKLMPSMIDGFFIPSLLARKLEQKAAHHESKS
jgi:hypothetical protein